MKYATAALTLLSATASLAAPTTGATSGYAVPSAIKIHDIGSSHNWPDTKTSTIRSGTFETSTLYDIPIPAEAEGKTCALVFKASPSSSDSIKGESAIDIFESGDDSADIAWIEEGFQRGQQMARIVFNAHTGIYGFKRDDFAPSVDSFPCPVGKTLHWEAAAVGEFDVNVVAQDFSYDGSNVPNGLSVAWF